jgi:anti-sigma factor RsiW
MSEMHELAGSYALNALDTTELAEFEAHLATCPTCQADVSEFCETAAELSLLSLATPPPELRDNILAAIQNTPQISADGTFGGQAPASPNGSRPREVALRTVGTGPRRARPETEVPDEPDEPGTELAPRVDEVALRRQRRRTRLLSGLVAAMLAVAVGLGGVVYTLVQDRRAQVASISLEQQLYAAPDVVFGPAKPLVGGGTGSFVFSRQLNRALFIGTDLPDPGRDKRYQLWTMDGPEPKWKVATRVTRDTQITDRDAAVKVFFSGDVAGSDWLCVSIEPKDNLTDTPTVPPVGSVEVDA